MQIGDQVGDYRLVREVGRGSFGVVYQAEQVYLGTQAAIKVLVDTAPEEREELLVEARKIAAWPIRISRWCSVFPSTRAFPIWCCNMPRTVA